MEIILEIIFELYLELMMLVVPKEHTASKKVRALAAVFAIVMMLGVIAAFIGGLVLIEKGITFGGIALIILSIAASLGQITAGFFVYSRDGKND